MLVRISQGTRGHILVLSIVTGELVSDMWDEQGTIICVSRRFASEISVAGYLYLAYRDRMCFTQGRRILFVKYLGRF